MAQLMESRNLEQLFELHAQRDMGGDGCFRLVSDAISLALGQNGRHFNPPKYLNGELAENWVKIAKSRFDGSLLNAWMLHLDSCKYLERVRDESNNLCPGNVALSGSGTLTINGAYKFYQDPVIGVISASCEMISRTNFGLCRVSPVAYAWRIICHK